MCLHIHAKSPFALNENISSRIFRRVVPAAARFWPLTIPNGLAHNDPSYGPGHSKNTKFFKTWAGLWAWDCSECYAQAT